MTIVTKPNIKANNEKKAEKTLGKPLVVNENPGGEYGDHTVIDPNNDDVEAWLSSSARRRVSTATTICVFITALLVMSVGIIGGVYLYRQFSHHQMSRFRGWCGIPYERETLHLMGNPKLPLGGNLKMPLDGNPKMPLGEPITGDDEELLDAGFNSGIHVEDLIPPSLLEPTSDEDLDYLENSKVKLFKEEFELDLEEENYEEIHVPDFGFGHEGRFLHDFKINMTGIVDLTFSRCFVMPLDRRHILPPRTVLDFIKKMWMGYYNVDTEVVRETMRVVYPPVEDYDSLGIYIGGSCKKFPTYMLERVYTPELRKRSVDAANEEELNLVEFAGKNILHYIIIMKEH